MNKSLAVVLVGLPASGKSTLIEKIKSSLGQCFVYSTDTYIEQVALQNNSTYNATFDSEIKYATQYMDNELATAIGSNVPIIWDQTNMSDKKRKKIIHKLHKTYKILCICIMPPQDKMQEEDLLFRISNRKGKTIPLYIIDRMLESFVIPTKEEGFCEVKYLDIYGNVLAVEKEINWQTEISRLMGYSRIGNNNI